jgi:hypothetical protein
MDLANDFVSQFVKGLDNFLLIEAAVEMTTSSRVGSSIGCWLSHFASTT